MTYISTLQDELRDAQRRLARSSQEGRWVIEREIMQIKRDIRRNSTNEERELGGEANAT